MARDLSHGVDLGKISFYVDLCTVEKAVSFSKGASHGAVDIREPEQRASKSASESLDSESDANSRGESLTPAGHTCALSRTR